MKTTHLKKRFYAFGKHLTPPFLKDASTKGDPDYVWVNQATAGIKRFREGQWEMLELQFDQKLDGIYLNAGLSPDEHHRRHSMPSLDEPGEYRIGTSYYFRAARLWTRESLTDCWFVKPRVLDVDALYREAGTADYVAVMRYLRCKYPPDSVDALELHMEWEQRLTFPPHCFFQTDGEAMADIEGRIVADVLPYFDHWAEKAKNMKA